MGAPIVIINKKLGITLSNGCSSLNSDDLLWVVTYILQNGWKLEDIEIRDKDVDENDVVINF